MSFNVGECGSLLTLNDTTRELGQLISRLEESIRVDEKLAEDVGSQQKPVVATQEGSIPLSNLSSKISELAHLILNATQVPQGISRGASELPTSTPATTQFQAANQLPLQQEVR